MMENCKIIEDLIPLYANEDLNEESKSLVKSHLDQCPACSELLKKEFVFKKAKKEHVKTKYSIWKSLTIAATVIFAIGAVFWVWAMVSYTPALLFAGIPKDQFVVVAENVKIGSRLDDCTVGVVEEDGHIRVVILSKDSALGAWIYVLSDSESYITGLEREMDSEYGSNSSLNCEQMEFWTVKCGENALKELEVPYWRVEDPWRYTIYQNENCYCVVINGLRYNSDGSLYEKIGDFDLFAFWEENGYISAKSENDP